MKVFYHLDLDGKCAGFCVRKFYETRATIDVVNPEIKMYEINYGWDFPWDDIVSGEIVYIVDFSIEPMDMTKLLDITKNVIWIDHHKTAIEKYNDYPYTIDGLRYDGIAGCVLTYCYLYLMNIGNKKFDESMVNDVPLFIQLIGDNDVWVFKYGDTTRNFVAGLYVYETNPSKEIAMASGAVWDRLFMENMTKVNGLLDEITIKGSVIRKYRNDYDARMVKSKGFKSEFDGHLVYALNISPGFANSSVFDSLENKEEYDAFIIFGFNGEIYNYSIYSTTIDVSRIASKYGGGGHKGAAGFSSEVMLLQKLPDQE